jgi:hypothetical protein
MHPRGPIFFPLIKLVYAPGVGSDGMDFFWEFGDPNVFQMVTSFSHYVLYGYLFCSQVGPSKFPCVPNSTTIFAIFFALSFTLVTCITNEKTTIYLF